MEAAARSPAPGRSLLPSPPPGSGLARGLGGFEPCHPHIPPPLAPALAARVVPQCAQPLSSRRRRCGRAARRRVSWKRDLGSGNPVAERRQERGRPPTWALSLPRQVGEPGAGGEDGGFGFGFGFVSVSRWGGLPFGGPDRGPRTAGGREGRRGQDRRGGGVGARKPARRGAGAEQRAPLPHRESRPQPRAQLCGSPRPTLYGVRALAEQWGDGEKWRS